MGNKLDGERINVNEEDEMIIIGYRRSYIKTFLTSLAVLLTSGLLLAFMSWKHSIHMWLTHQRCSFEDAQKVLLVDSYGQQYAERIVRPSTKTSKISKDNMFFYNKKIKYIWVAQHNKFLRVEGLEDTNCAHFYNLTRGLSASEATYRLEHYGVNSIFIRVEPVVKLIFREIRSPFYIYQMFIVVIWLIELYYQFAVCIVLLSIISVTATVWETRRQSRALRDAVRTDAVVTVLRDGNEEQKPSEELVPGDIIILPQTEFTMVCDAVLLSGNCVVNESMLTGESIPITKVPIANDPTLPFSTSIQKRSTLFCGTQILHSRNVEEGGIVRAVIYRTGFSTSKGELVRAILFPKPVNFKLYADLLKCMIAFFFLGIPIMIYTALTWIHLGAYVRDIIIIVADVITFLVPPVLPAVLTSINAHAQRRLRKHGIFCLNSRYINFCGGLDVVCFDKTGTLTEDSLDFSGAVPAGNGRFEVAVKDFYQLTKGSMVMAMATCHSLSKIEDKLLGHTLDVKLFEAIGWELHEPMPGEEVPFEKIPPRIVYPKNDPNQSVAIIRQFPFESLLRRMSVVTKSKDSNSFQVYMKGAPESVVTLSLPGSIPEDFKDVLEFYTRQGFRVIAVGSKTLPENVTWNETMLMKREELECELNFQGLVVLQNKLKPQTVPTLQQLKDANIRTIMVTGDNLLTALTVSRDCGMIEERDSVISIEAEMIPSATGQRLRVHYRFVKLPGFSEKLNLTQNGLVDEICLAMSYDEKYHIAVEGKSFNLIRLHDVQLLKKVVYRGTIFARMLPEHKLFLIETLQGLGYQVGMCGDGANDCGALKTANAGVSLSVAEASVASPFTATEQNIQCIPAVIREGRAALSATFGAFRYMVCYCFMLLSAVLILFWDGQKPSDGGYVITDIVLNILPPILFGGTAAYPGLVKRPPTRSIVSFLPQFSIFSFLLIQITFYVISYEFCQIQPWYEPFVYNNATTHAPAPSHTGTTVLTMNIMSYVIAAVVFSPGPPYRKSFFSNKIYLSVVAVEFVFVSWIALYPADFMIKFMNLRRAPFIEYHLVIYSLSLANFIISYLWEVFFVQGILFDHVVPRLRKLRGPIHKFEKLERELLTKKDWPPVGKFETSKTLTYDDDDGDPGVRKSSINRGQWSKRSQEFRRSLLSLVRSGSQKKDPRTEMPMSFVTFKDGKHEIETVEPLTSQNQNFV